MVRIKHSKISVAYLTLLLTIVAAAALVTSAAGDQATDEAHLYVIEYGEMSAQDAGMVAKALLGYDIVASASSGQSSVEVTAPGINKVPMTLINSVDGDRNATMMFSREGIVIISFKGSGVHAPSSGDVINALKAAGWGGLMSAVNVSVTPKEYAGYVVYDICVDGVRVKYPVSVKGFTRDSGFVSGWFPTNPRIAYVIGYDPVDAVMKEASKYLDVSEATVKGPVYMPDLMNPDARRILPTYVVTAGGDAVYLQLDEYGAHAVIRASFAGKAPSLGVTPILEPYDVRAVTPGNTLGVAEVAIALAAAVAGGAGIAFFRRRNGSI